MQWVFSLNVDNAADGKGRHSGGEVSYIKFYYIKTLKFYMDATM